MLWIFSGPHLLPENKSLFPLTQKSSMYNTLALFKSWNYWTNYREKQFKSLITCLFNILLETENNLISKNTKDESRKLIWRGSFSKICGIYFPGFILYIQRFCVQKRQRITACEKSKKWKGKNISSLCVSNYYAWATDYLIFFPGQTLYL